MIVNLDDNQSIILIKIDDETNEVMVTVNNSFRSDYYEEDIDRILEVVGRMMGTLNAEPRENIPEDIIFEPDPELVDRIDDYKKSLNQSESKIIFFPRRKQ